MKSIESFSGDFRQIDVDLASYPCLSKGNDSYVYRMGEKVAKEYQNLSLAEVQRYITLQNSAAHLLTERQYQTKIRIDGVLHSVVATEAIPVDELAISASGKPLAISRFVEAPNLEKLLWRPEKFAEYANAQLSNPRLYDFASRMNDFFWNEYPTRAQDEFHYHTCMLSRLFDRELGFLGCYISKYNIKLYPVPDEARINLIVTDVALYIDRLAEAPERDLDAQMYAEPG